MIPPGNPRITANEALKSRSCLDTAGPADPFPNQRKVPAAQLSRNPDTYPVCERGVRAGLRSGLCGLCGLCSPADAAATCSPAVRAEEFVFWVNSGIMSVYKAPRGREGGAEPASSPAPLLPLVPPPLRITEQRNLR